MARRQEQEQASSEVTEVAPDVLRLQLPIRMPGLGHVNCYALIDGDGAALVDPGLPGPGTWRTLEKRLRQASLRVRNVHTVIVTHSHPDHFGGASRLAREAGARIVAHRSFRFGGGSQAPEVSVEDLAAQPLQLPTERTAWGGQSPRMSLKHRLRWRFLQWISQTSFVPSISDPIEQGDVLRLAGREWFVVHTPGHTADHICLHAPETQTFLAGDHVLPSITPHISGITPARDPLDSFFSSLDRVGEIPDVSCVLPAHGHPFEDLRGRADAIKLHHHQRLEKLRKIGRELGPASVAAFTRRLFPRRSWGSMAESETYAHLEHLRIAGDAESRSDDKGRIIYATG